MRNQTAMMLLALGLLAVAAVGCGGGKEPEPAAINEAVDKCELCNMQVSDDGFATQLLTKEGKVYKFDDIGCMNAWKNENRDVEIVIEFVRDHHTREWIKLDSAFFAYDPTFKTPMAYGLVSFKDEASAREFIEAEGKGVLLSAADLATHSWERNAGGMHGDHAHDEHEHAEQEHAVHEHALPGQAGHAHDEKDLTGNAS